MFGYGILGTLLVICLIVWLVRRAWCPLGQPTGINWLRKMEYKEGSTVKVRLHSGQEVTAEITAILNNSAGRKIRIVYEGRESRRSRFFERSDMTAKDYIDTKAYWISPDRSIRRMGDEGGDQQIIAKATEECSEAEWNRICDALKVSLFKMG